jgi:hypothetical protein
MNVELIISKDRIPYLIEQLGVDRVTVSNYDEGQDAVKFELNSPLDALFLFHAGIKCGSDSMANALIKK